MSDTSIRNDGSLNDDGHCFACGKDNPIGLGMRVTYGDDESARCEITLDKRYQGWHEVIHGGIVTTLLDEIMAHAMIRHVGQSVTTGIEVRYSKPMRVGRPVVVEGRVEEKRRLIRCTAQVTDAETGAVLATAKSNFMLLKANDA
jgi:uncharacterized protein (TIGR00369 family)